MDQNINISAMKNVKVILCPTYELATEEAKKYSRFATVEAEYGDKVVTGSSNMGPWASLAHHGSRSTNPAPCCWNLLGAGNVSPILPEVILVSHIDLDTLGGIGLLLGYFNADEQEFWNSAALIDVKGPHHIEEVPEGARAQLRAFWGWNEQHRSPRFARDVVTDVTDLVAENFSVLDRIVKNDADLIAAGQAWNERVTAAVESCLVYESEKVRAFCGGLFTASSYLGSDGGIRVATVSLNTKTHAVTLAFEDGGDDVKNAAAILQSIFGPEAGGRAGIAGTPRGKVYDVRDLVNVIERVELLLDPNAFASAKHAAKLGLRWGIEYPGE